MVKKKAKDIVHNTNGTTSSLFLYKKYLKILVCTEVYCYLEIYRRFQPNKENTQKNIISIRKFKKLGILYIKLPHFALFKRERTQGFKILQWRTS